MEKPALPTFMFDPAHDSDPQAPWMDQFSHAVINNRPEEVAKLLSGYDTLPKWSRGLWTSCCTSTSPPIDALGAWAGIQPPPSTWISDIIDFSVSSGKAPSWGPLLKWWVGCPDVPSAHKQQAIKEGVHKIMDLLEANSNSGPVVFREFLPALTSSDNSWPKYCGTKALVGALLADVLLPQCSGLTDRFNSQALGMGYLQAISSSRITEMLWGLGAREAHPQRALQNWNEWLNANPSRLNAWQELEQLDTQSLSVLNDWSQVWLKNDRWTDSPLSKWMSSPSDDVNPFNHPLFLKDYQIPDNLNFSGSFQYTNLSTVGSPETLAISLAQEFFKWARGLGEEDKVSICDALVDSAVFAIVPSAPNIISIACRAQSSWIHEISRNKNTVGVLQEHLADLRTLYYWHATQSPEELLKVISRNKEQWSQWRDPKGANLLLSWCQAQTSADIPDKFAKGFYNLMPHWFSQPDNGGATILGSGVLSHVVRSEIAKDLLEKQVRGDIKQPGVSKPPKL